MPPNLPRLSDSDPFLLKPIQVLDHGFVELVDFMGNDAAIVEAARVTHASQTKATPSSDESLIRYLFRHRHSSPFESCVIKLHVKLPIFVERQWARHRTAGWNEISGRYCQLPEEYYVPSPEAVATQSATNKQGRNEFSDVDSEILQRYLADCSEIPSAAFDSYHKSLRNKIANELARLPLPLSTYTEKYWWINLHNLLHFLGLRMDSHAQWEIRQYANIIASITKQLFPVTYKAFEDYKLNAMTFSAGELQQLAAILQCDTIIHRKREDFRVDFTSNERESNEFLDKLESLGFFI